MARIWIAVGLLLVFAALDAQQLVRSHLEPKVGSVKYDFRQKLPARRGSIFDCRDRPLVESIPVWDYRLDPVSLTNRLGTAYGPARTVEAVSRTIAMMLKLDYAKVLKMTGNFRNQYQFLGTSSDPQAHDIIADRKMVAGVMIEERDVRTYLNGRLLAHVLGSVNSKGNGLGGIEQRYNSQLTGIPGEIHGMRDALKRELYDKRIVSVAPVTGASVYLTVDSTLQYEVETVLADGVGEYGAARGWSIVMDAHSGAILAMACYPDFDPADGGMGERDSLRINRACAHAYEPGSVMKVITAAAAVEAGLVTPDTLYPTNRDDERYYRLPGDGRHVWEPQMSIRDAIVHSSNIVIGKLGCDLGPERLWTSMRAFGFGECTQVELPAESAGILPHWKKWHMIKWSRAPIGQGVSVTALQLCSAYQAIANDGERMRPHLVRRVVAADGSELYRHIDVVCGRPISAMTARTVREMMCGVAKKGGTAPRAAIPGYSIAAKTCTAQKIVNGRYSETLHVATFCGMVPATEPEIVILVSLDFDRPTKCHQGGNSSALMWRKIAEKAICYLRIAPDQLSELLEHEDAAR